MKARYSCAVELAVDVMGGKWKPVILARLKEGPHRYGQLRRAIPSITEKVLTAQLRELAGAGLVDRTEVAGRVPTVEYRLTPEGDELRPALTALYEWGSRYAERNGIPVGTS
ncbi:helix-turn-helix domain-containing protein [Amycolatopsis sp. NPDC004079]|uniref:winged helix-turn-helix transcriptional regulator n=1 Tax=Amycolatopsis sp. NPDC004079 TaxID=3154549 RepID=UPI0033A4312D